MQAEKGCLSIPTAISKLTPTYDAFRIGGWEASPSLDDFAGLSGLAFFYISMDQN